MNLKKLDNAFSARQKSKQSDNKLTHQEMPNDTPSVTLNTSLWGTLRLRSDMRPPRRKVQSSQKNISGVSGDITVCFRPHQRRLSCGVTRKLCLVLTITPKKDHPKVPG